MLEEQQGEVAPITELKAKNPGATSKEWDTLLASEWPLSEILPVVCDPSIEIHPTSVLSAASIGKIPTDISGEYVVGIPGWPGIEMRYNEDRIARYRKHPAIGFGIRTNKIHFIDVDIDVPEEAEQVRRVLEAELGEGFPYRGRGGSSRFAVPVRIDGVSSLRKSVIKIPNTGAVEFLCNGNFIVMAGMHTKSGERYHWVDESSKIPSMTEQEFVTLCTKIAESFGLEWAPSRRGADAVEVSAEDMDPSDPVVAFVRDFHLKPGGRVLPHIMDIVCPFADTHTSTGGISDTSLVSTGSGEPYIKCMHAHCSDRSQAEFLTEMGYFESDAYATHLRQMSEKLDTDDRVSFEFRIPRLTRQQVLQGFAVKGLPGLSYYVGNTDESALMNLLCNPPVLGLDIRHDTFTGYVCAYTRRGEEIPYGPGLTRAVHAAVEAAMGDDAATVKAVEKAIDGMQRYRGFDSALQWADSLRWDGVPRIHKFFTEYVPVETSVEHAEAAAWYWWLSAAGRLLNVADGVKADVLITLKGKQGARKSTLVECLAPEAFVTRFKPESNPTKQSIEDRYRRMRGKLVVEIEDFKGESKNENIQNMEKAFISSRYDSWVEKYLTIETRRVRRCMFMATSNRFHLYDPTGSRRHCLLELKPGKLDTEAVMRIRDQLWAEAIQRYSSNPASQGHAHMNIERFSEDTINKAYVHSNEDEATQADHVSRIVAQHMQLYPTSSETRLAMSIALDLGLNGRDGVDQAGRMVVDFMNAHGIHRSRRGELSAETMAIMASVNLI